MALQNRVDPWGALHAVTQRGTMMGNRGGKFHRDDQTLGKLRWASHHWICCEVHFKDRHHEPMGKGYTSLFFLDEVTALSAGHRPCFECRRAEAKAFSMRRRAEEFDRSLRAERISRFQSSKPVIVELPVVDGVMVEIRGEAYASKSGKLLHWSFGGYNGAIPLQPVDKVLTPPSIIAILAAGYKPRWHTSAYYWDGK